MRVEELYMWPSHRRAWMGKYPRKGADWSPEEDAVLLRAYESDRYLNKEIAAMHLREPVAIERRLGVLRNRREGLPQISRNWPTERETAQQVVSKIKEAYAGAMWPGERALRPCGIKPGLLLGGASPCIVVACPYGIDLVALSDLPPEVAQALQFGQGDEA